MLRRPATQIQLTPEDLHAYEDMKEQQRAATAMSSNAQGTPAWDQNIGFDGTSPAEGHRTRSMDSRLGLPGPNN